MRGVAVALLLAGVLAGVLAWPRAPQGPEALFAVRCATCHALPDLEGYSARERRGIVMTMLRERGADQVITPDEARAIIGYIAPQDASVSQKDQADGDT